MKPYVIPSLDPVFAQLPVAARKKVERTLALLRECAIAPGASNLERVRAVARLRGWSVSTLLRAQALFRQDGWAALVDRRLAPAPRPPLLPADFISFWQRLVVTFHGRTRAARQHLLISWSAGETIPGYGTWREWTLAQFPGFPLPRTEVPAPPRGWSVANLRRFNSSSTS